MQIMTKINDFEEIFFKSSIIFHVFAPQITMQKLTFNFCIVLFYIINKHQKPQIPPQKTTSNLHNMI